MIPIIKLNRESQDRNQSLSSCVVINAAKQPVFAGIAIERGWRNNERGVSCIPAGTYNVVLEWSNKYKRMLWEIKGVPGRSETKFHSMNYWYDSEGCIGLGRRPKFLNADRYLDVTSSVPTMRDFHRALKGHTKAKLIITTEINIH